MRDFGALTTLSAPHLLFCRKSIPLSQQLRQKSGRFLGKSQKFPYLCIVKTSIKRVKSRMQFELFRAEEVKSNAQSEQTTSVRQDKKVSLTIKNYKIMTQMNEMSARALSMEELENVNGGIRVKSKGGETDPRHMILFQAIGGLVFDSF